MWPPLRYDGGAPKCCCCIACCMVNREPCPREAVNLAFRIVSSSIVSELASRDGRRGRRKKRAKMGRFWGLRDGEGGAHQEREGGWSGLAGSLAVARVALE